MSRLAQSVERMVRELRTQARPKGARRMDDDFDGEGGMDRSLDALLSGDPEPGGLQGDGATETAGDEGASDMAKKATTTTRKAKAVRAQKAEKAAKAPRAPKAPKPPKAPREKVTDPVSMKLEDKGLKTVFINTRRSLMKRAFKAGLDAGVFTPEETEAVRKFVQRIDASE